MKRIKFTKTDIEKLEHPTGKIHFCISLFYGEFQKKQKKINKLSILNKLLIK